MLVSSTATAQGQAGGAPQAADNQASAIDEVVVTGTLLRGVAPAGTNTVDMDREEIVSTGAASAMQVLADIPQVTNAFNAIPTIPAFGVARTIIRPSIRNIGIVTGGSSTLVLIDGHRAVGAGTLENTPDVDVIPAGVLERVDVVPDGGSSIYGSDAVGGVINFITRRRFDGLEVTSHAGVADNYYSVDVNLTGGKDWGSGSAYLSYFFTQNDAIFGRDRDYVRQVTPASGSCAPGTVRVTRAGVTTNYALPGRAPGTISACDFTDNFSVFPRSSRHSLFGGLTQSLSDNIDVDVRAFYTRRRTVRDNDFNQDGNLFATSPQTGTITATNPYYVPIAPDPGSQSVNFSYAGVFDDRGVITLEEYGVTPTVTAKLGSDWELRVLGNYGRSQTRATTPTIDTNAQAAALAGTTLATALNPYNLGATNPAVLASINRFTYSPARQEMLNGRAILDGALFTLPGGEVRAAAGVEYLREEYAIRQDTYAPGVLAPTVAAGASGHRNVKAVFGELSVPIIGQDNSLPGVRSLVLSLSGRYDDYSDFGDTFNPKVGLTYQPVEWISVRGNFGKSYNAPGLADSAGIKGVQLFAVSPFRAATDPFVPNFFRPTIILAGSNPNLRPQKADTWSFGIDIEPPIVEGLRVSLTHYNIEVKDIIGAIPFFSPAAFAPAYAALVIKNPTLAQAQAASAGLTPSGNFASVEALFAAAGTPYVLMDARQNNLGELRQNGIDFNISYSRDTSFGSINAGFSGTYTLKRDSSVLKGQPFVDQLDSPGASDLSFLARLGARVGNLSGTVKLNHSEGYDVDPNVGGQVHVKSFNTVDLFFSYDVEGKGLLKDLSLTLNVDNLFDKDPPFFNQNNGYTNGSTLGRFVQVGLRKTF